MNSELNHTAGEHGPDDPPEHAPNGRRLEKIRELLALVQEHDLSEFKLEDGAFRLSVKRGSAATPMPLLPVPATNPAAAPQESASDAISPEDGLADITAPIVGTFYRTSTPESDSLVSVGQEVEADTVVCIIEAMKVMNEVKAEVRGVIRRVLVDNATSVQYGQPLFKIEPR